MPKEIFINISPQEKRVAILNNKRLEEFYAERADSVNLVANIYKGKVESVLPGMGAAFVDIGLEKNGFLYVTDVAKTPSEYEDLMNEGSGEDPRADGKSQKAFPSISELLKKGDDVLVQVVKEPISSKGARLTAHISIAGRFLVLMPFDNHVGISKRIEDRKEKDRIRSIFKELRLPKDIGFIVRTAAHGANKKDFFREARYLMRLWHNIKNRSSRVKAPQLIHEEYDLVLRVARDIFTNDFSKLEVDSKDEFRRISRFFSILSPNLRSKLRLHSEKVPLFEKFDVEKQVDRLYNRIINLRSGGYLVFDETESLVAIDVNSGKFVGKRNLEDTAFRTNMEAAEEVPRQLRLRDIGGIIIIDFIDMEIAHHRKAVFKMLEKHLEDDKARTKILNISSIGLVEMTRQRMRRSIEGKFYQRCPYCKGRGLVKSASTVSIEVYRKLERVLYSAKGKELFVFLHPEVASYVSKPGNGMIKSFEQRFKKAIRVIDDPNIHMEEIKIEGA